MSKFVLKKTIKLFEILITCVIIKSPGEYAFSQNMATRTKIHREQREYGVERLFLIGIPIIHLCLPHLVNMRWRM